ncbi:MAG: 4Fe-4S dicluster domain-containing protein, partial [Phycisphaerales bacterium]
CGFPLCSALRASGEGPAEAGSPASQFAMVIDIEKCLQEEVRRACTEACSREHNVPEIPDPEDEVKWIWAEEYEHVFPDQAHAHTEAAMKAAPVLVLCNHCTRPSCVRVCPTAATWKREKDGLVMMDMHRCIGCRYCIAACPYGARSFNWRDPRPYIKKDENGELPSNYPTRSKGVVEKCSFCEERVRFGRMPACVEAANRVPGGEGALTFGDLSKPDSEVRKILREKRTICRRISLGTGPNVYYIV